MLVLIALIAQSIAESRLLIEYGLFLLALIAIKTKRPDREMAMRQPEDPAPSTGRS